jgi:hypothetical protein
MTVVMIAMIEAVKMVSRGDSDVLSISQIERTLKIKPRNKSKCRHPQYHTPTTPTRNSDDGSGDGSER